LGGGGVCGNAMLTKGIYLGPPITALISGEPQYVGNYSTRQYIHLTFEDLVK